VVLVLVVLAIIIPLPGHGAVGDADVALGGDGGGLAAEVPVIEGVSIDGVVDSAIVVCPWVCLLGVGELERGPLSGGGDMMLLEQIGTGQLFTIQRAGKHRT
jgi:hypothetical protein